MQRTQEDIIIEHVKIVTTGIIETFKPNNSYSNWKNTPQGLDLIKTNKTNFYLGVNMWLNITQNQLLGSENNEILEILKNQFSWINNILEIKKIINYQEI
tara:strand:- start:64 stop:363 length:300 start_codon:yes stop_codon:yes gene_type:complete